MLAMEPLRMSDCVIDMCYKLTQESYKSLSGLYILSSKWSSDVSKIVSLVFNANY